MTVRDLQFPVPHPARAVRVIEAPGRGDGYWAGAPSATYRDGAIYLAYRLRRPVDRGRGYANVVARSEDGVSFETLAVLSKEDLGTASFERPALVPLPDGGWRIYLSCAVEDSKRWWIAAIDAAEPAAFDPGRARTVFAGDDGEAVKDPVVHHDGDRWSAWICCHPLEPAGEEDRMHTRVATSADGLSWQLGAVALSGRAGSWDARGARLASVLSSPTGRWAYYDGRASQEMNWYERTGIAVAEADGLFRAVDPGPVAVAGQGSGALRYLSAVPLPDGSLRLYYEMAGADGSHDLYTELTAAPPVSTGRPATDQAR